MSNLFTVHRPSEVPFSAMRVQNLPLLSFDRFLEHCHRRPYQLHQPRNKFLELVIRGLSGLTSPDTCDFYPKGCGNLSHITSCV